MYKKQNQKKKIHSCIVAPIKSATLPASQKLRGETFSWRWLKKPSRRKFSPHAARGSPTWNTVEHSLEWCFFLLLYEALWCIFLQVHISSLINKEKVVHYVSHTYGKIDLDRLAHGKHEVETFTFHVTKRTIIKFTSWFICKQQNCKQYQKAFQSYQAGQIPMPYITNRTEIKLFGFFPHSSIKRMQSLYINCDYLKTACLLWNI